MNPGLRSLAARLLCLLLGTAPLGCSESLEGRATYQNNGYGEPPIVLTQEFTDSLTKLVRQPGTPETPTDPDEPPLTMASIGKIKIDGHEYRFWPGGVLIRDGHYWSSKATNDFYATFDQNEEPTNASQAFRPQP